jgi:hypothetical protein
VAARIEAELGVKPELTEGRRGEFAVFVGDKKVAKKRWFQLPSEETVLRAVSAALG